MKATKGIRLSLKLGLLTAVVAAVALPTSDTAAAPALEVKKLVHSDPAAGDKFGGSVSVSEDTAIVGAYAEDGGGTGRGAAYVFERDLGGADNWGEVKKLGASDTEDDDSFGWSVAVDANTAIVGASHEDGAGGNRGAAYIYQRDLGGPDNWGEVKKLTAPDAENGDFFGGSVAVDGDIAVVGASSEDGANVPPLGGDRGAAYVFQRDHGGPDNWGFVKKLTASDAEDYDLLGMTVATSGDIAVLGAPGEDGAGLYSGAAYIFRRDQGGTDNWGEAKKLTASDAAAYDSFGMAGAVNGNTVVVGAPHEEGAFAFTGAVYVFRRDQGGPGNWGEVKKVTASDAAYKDGLGMRVAVNGTTVIAGALWAVTMNSTGSAYVFERFLGGTDNWGEVAEITGSDAELGDDFGSSVALDGGTAIIGAWGNDVGASVNVGAAYVFQLPRSPVGGVAELPEVEGAPAEAGGSSGTGIALGIAAAITAATLALSGAAWYLRRVRAGR